MCSIAQQKIVRLVALRTAAANGVRRADPHGSIPKKVPRLYLAPQTRLTETGSTFISLADRILSVTPVLTRCTCNQFSNAVTVRAIGYMAQYSSKETAFSVLIYYLFPYRQMTDRESRSVYCDGISWLVK